MIQIGVTPEYLVAFALILSRVGGLMVFAPFWGSFMISRSIRVLLALALSFVLFPLLQDRLPALPSDPTAIAMGVFSELLIGFLLGLVGQLLMSALQIAGALMGFQMGFSLVNIIDPQSSVEVSVISLMHNLAGVTLCLVLNAHHWYLNALVESYRLVAPFTASLGGAAAQELLRLSSGMFLTGVKLALPIVAVGLVLDFLLGVVGRSAPQIHILIAGLPLKILVGFVMLTFTINALLPFLQREFSILQRDLFRILGSLG